MKIEEKNGQLVIVDFNEAEAYKVACKIERDGINFYKNLIEKENNLEVKKELEFLLLDEKKHLKVFEDKLIELEEKIDDKFEGDDLLSYMEYGVFEPLKNIKNLEDVINNTQKALRLAIVAEEHSIKFYEACKDKVTSLETKEALSAIIEEEEKHKDVFNNMMKSLK